MRKAVGRFDFSWRIIEKKNLTFNPAVLRHCFSFVQFSLFKAVMPVNIYSSI